MRLNPGESGENQYVFLKDTERMVAMGGDLYKPYSQVNELA